MCGKNAVKKGLLLSLSLMMLILMLRATSTSASFCRADLDGDGKVHYSDLKIMNSEIGRNDCTVTPCQADFDDDGKVTPKDREILYTEFGKGDCRSRKDTTFEEKIDALTLRQDEQFEADGDGGEEVSTPYEVAEEENLQREAAQSTRFEDNGDGTVTDSKTGLMWTRNANIIGDTVLFHQARNYVNGMNAGDNSNFGFTDWRLPTLRELQSLIEYAEFSSEGHVLPSGHPFQKVQSLEFYNSTSPTYLSNPDHSWLVDAYCRIVGHNATSCFGFAWPVRGAE